MRYLSADHVFSAHTGFIPNGILVLNDDGTVSDLLDPRHAADIPDAERLDGTICPGFINAHCHLELSHLKGKIRKNTGFVGFAKELIPMRGKFSAEEIARAVAEAEEEMYTNGIVAVGDISNTADTVAQKKKGTLRYHTFVELLGLKAMFAEPVCETGRELLKKFPEPASLAPHAPYSVSESLLKLIAADCEAAKRITTIHNQESGDENEFFISGKGKMKELYAFLKMDISYFNPPGVNSLRRTLPQLPGKQNLVLVHNTFTSAEDFQWANSTRENIFWCLCPNANLYIENTLPDFSVFTANGAKIVVGTDSYASNEKLSVFSELQVIHEKAPGIGVETLLTWATQNGAEALRMNELGSFEADKKPGVLLLKGVSPEKISAEAAVKRLV
ncbi:MAG TPA: amidohydrolase family protein [Bacteroidia bacterium]|nr:amidohydrolase family protein [Bacteroidia bacterium]